jgi:hypothetical protein
MLDMQKWAGSFKVIGPISSPPISFIQRVRR